MNVKNHPLKADGFLLLDVCSYFLEVGFIYPKLKKELHTM